MRSVRNRQYEFKQFFSQESDPVFCSDVTLLQQLFETNTIQLFGVRLLTLKKSA
jgi:hypothetical protein